MSTYFQDYDENLQPSILSTYRERDALASAPVVRPRRSRDSMRIHAAAPSVAQVQHRGSELPSAAGTTVLLPSRQNIHSTAINGWTPFYRAVVRGQSQIARVLMKEPSFDFAATFSRVASAYVSPGDFPRQLPDNDSLENHSIVLGEMLAVHSEENSEFQDNGDWNLERVWRRSLILDHTSLIQAFIVRRPQFGGINPWTLL